jgi:cell division protein FtsN
VPPSAALASAPAKTALKPGTDPYTYFAQAGAYSRAEDAQAQRAKLALIGLDAKIVEREQSGRTVYRVRLGPFEKRPDAEAMLERLNSASVESSLVRVERQ